MFRGSIVNIVVMTTFNEILVSERKGLFRLLRRRMVLVAVEVLWSLLLGQPGAFPLKLKEG